MRSGHYLPGFLQGFPYGSPQPTLRETYLLLSRQVACVVAGEWAHKLHPDTVINSSFSVWQLVTNGVPQRSILGPTLFNIYIRAMDDGIMCTMMKFADDMKLSGEMEILEERAIL